MQCISSQIKFYYGGPAFVQFYTKSDAYDITCILISNSSWLRNKIE